MHGAGPKLGVKGIPLDLCPTRLGGSMRAAVLLSVRAPHHPQEAVLYPNLGLCQGSGHFFQVLAPLAKSFPLLWGG